MKPRLFLLALLCALTTGAAAGVADTPSVWHAPHLRYNAIAGYFGMMDTEMLGEGDIVGGSLEISPVPFFSLQLRASYADHFEGITEFAHDLLPHVRHTLKIEEFSVVPLELGIVGRFPILPYVGIYGGGGWGYYVIPTFEAVSATDFSIAEDIDDISGWWWLLGAEAGLHPLYVFVEAKYTHIVADDYTVEVDYYGIKGTLKADIDLSGTMLLAGIRLKW
ncbi:MAG: hypothetical protein ACOX9C_04540 [Kiritimatiellia bacterium]|jgi:hypothetical protein